MPLAPPQSVTLTAPEVAALVWRSVRGEGGPFGIGRLGETEVAQLVAICLRESGGVTGAIRPASKNPAGGNDIGLMQLNDKWNSFDAAQARAALDAFWNMFYAVTKSAHGLPSMAKGLDLSPWGGPNNAGGDPIAAGYENSHPLTVNDTAKNAANKPADWKTLEAKLVAAGHISDQTKWREAFGLTGEVTVYHEYFPGQQEAAETLGAVGAWLESLGRILANLLRPEWWKRLGIGVLGAALLIAAVAFGVYSVVKDGSQAAAALKG